MAGEFVRRVRQNRNGGPAKSPPSAGLAVHPAAHSPASHPNTGAANVHPRTARRHPRRQVHQDPGAGADQRSASHREADAAAARGRPARGPEHRRLCQRLPRLAGGRHRPGHVGGESSAGRRPDRVRAGRERRPCRHRGLGHAAAAQHEGEHGRRCVRALVRQGSGCGPGRRSAQARQLRRHPRAGWRAGGFRRRPPRQELDHRSPQRTGDGRARHAHPVPVQRQRVRRVRSAGLRAVALQRLLGRVQGRQRNHRADRHRRHRPGCAALRASAHRRSAARGHPLARQLRADGRRDDLEAHQAAAGPQVRSRQRHRPAGLRAGAGALRPGHRRQGLPGHDAGPEHPGAGRRARAGAGHRGLQGGHDLAAGARRHDRVRGRQAGTDVHRRKEPLRRKPVGGPAVQPAGAPAYHRQERRDRPAAAALRRPARAHRSGAGHRPAPAGQWHLGRGPGRAGIGNPLVSRRAAGGGQPGRQAPAVLLLGLPAQHLDQLPAGQRGHLGHRLSRHGGVGQARHAAGHADGRRGRQLGRSAPFHQDQTRVPEPGRRHLFPFGPAGHPPGDRQRRQHHLQDPVQRRGRDDRRPAGRRHGDPGDDRPAGGARRGEEDRAGQRRPLAPRRRAAGRGGGAAP